MSVNGSVSVDAPTPAPLDCHYLFLKDVTEAILAGCSIDAFPAANYTADSFHEDWLIPALHGSPRFTQRRDVVDYTNGTERDQQLYLFGLYTSAVLSWIFFLMWAIFLCFSKRRQACGFLSGTPPNVLENDDSAHPSIEKEDERDAIFYTAATEDHWHDEHKLDSSKSGKEPTWPEKRQMTPTALNDAPVDHDAPTENVDINANNELQQSNFQRRIRRCRIALLFCMVGAWICSGLLLGMAFPSVDRLIGTAMAAIPPVVDKLEEAREVTVSFLEERNDLSEDRTKMINDILELCEIDETEIPTFGNITYNLTAEEIEELILTLNETVANLTYLSDFIEEINETFYKVSKDLTGVETTLDSIDDWWYYVAGAFVVLVDIMILSFCVGVVLSWIQRQPILFRDANNRFILPLFCVCLLLAYLISTFCLVFSEVVADFCIDTPDNQVIRIIDAPWPLDGYVAWYVSGCTEGAKPAELFMVVSNVGRVLTNVNREFQDFVNDTTLDDVNLVCPESGKIIYDSLGLFADNLQSLFDLAGGMLRALRCPEINSLYTVVAYEVACDNGIDALMRVFAYLFGLALFCMVIVTLRVTWYEVDARRSAEEDEPNDLIFAVEEDEDQAPGQNPEEAASSAVVMSSRTSISPSTDTDHRVGDSMDIKLADRANEERSTECDS